MIAATGIGRPLLVDWSYGAAQAVRYAAEHPGEVAGIVLVDGAFPIAMLSEAEKDQARQTFRRMAPLMRVASLFGLSPRMPAAQAAEINIELNELVGGLGPDYERIECPVAFIIGSTAHTGATDEQVRRMRACITPFLKRQANISLFATLPSSQPRSRPRTPTPSWRLSTTSPGRHRSAPSSSPEDFAGTDRIRTCPRRHDRVPHPATPAKIGSHDVAAAARQ